ncbi:MAG: LOG family protein [Chloroflexi bacterium]|nr:LOG family protein [Chloroflexota bacterium]
MKIISIFGSASPKPGSPAYQDAYEVGRLLAQAGYGVMSGGYAGTMAAASQGASEGGGHVIGVTSAQIEQYRQIPPNQWVKQEVRQNLLRERVMYLVLHNDGMIVMPGGIGTLSEMALAWSLMQVGDISPRPFILFGPTWQQTIHTFFDEAYIKPKDFDLLQFAGSPETAVQMVLGWQGGKLFI